jgi:P27 family predicted phage terminase small subunit
MGVLSPQYAETLGMFCEACADVQRLNETPEAFEPTIAGEKGGTFKNPAWVARQDAQKKLVAFAREFGLSASAARGVAKVGGEAKADSLQEFRKGGA